MSQHRGSGRRRGRRRGSQRRRLAPQQATATHRPRLLPQRGCAERGRGGVGCGGGCAGGWSGSGHARAERGTSRCVGRRQPARHGPSCRERVRAGARRGARRHIGCADDTGAGHSGWALLSSPPLTLSTHSDISNILFKPHPNTVIQFHHAISHWSKLSSKARDATRHADSTDHRTLCEIVAADDVADGHLRIPVASVTRRWPPPEHTVHRSSSTG
mmetsp:Transcript_14860/g.32292  ORF Transcript_14860/g.32292 Transcript_14860/m.32292 type:complete len:216 (+) Transcript_14860:1049-1696(+)